MFGLSTASGDTKLLDGSWAGRSVVIGAKIAEQLNVASADAGVILWVNDRPVDVIAILASSGDSLKDNSLVFSRNSQKILSLCLDSSIYIRSISGFAEPLRKAIPLALMPENPGGIQISVVAQLAQLQQGINSDMSHLLFIIGGLILVLSTLTASISMFLSVQHRSAEIALRRALGASKTSIRRLFCYEGTIIGLAGGLTGTAFGVWLSRIMSYIQQWPLSLGGSLILLGVLAGVCAGLAASMYPAIHAAQKDPAQILRAV